MVIPPIPPSPPTPPTAATGSSAASSGASSTAGASDGFSNNIMGAIDQLQNVADQRQSQAAQVAAGQGNIGDAMIAATQASVDTQVTQAMVTKAVDAFNSIMGMSF